ncbi:MAG: thiamine-phosphate kinase [Acidimicrobiales bacterium]
MAIPGPGSDDALDDGAGARHGEFAAIERIRQGLAGRFGGPPSGEVWIGDDAAVLDEQGGSLLLTTDLTVAGVHADLDLMGLDDLGWRAFVAAVSDIAAMGGAPCHAMVGVAGPPSTNLDLLYEGIGSAAEAHDCPVVGGDLSTAWALVVSVAVTGRIQGPAPPVLRSGASPGDSLFVTRALGASAAGLRVLREHREHRRGRARAGGDAEAVIVAAHLRPRARLREGVTARQAGASAMIDISDGLALDVGHLAEASGVGFALEKVPVAVGARDDEALGGGEDYELVIATQDPDRLVAAFVDAGFDVPILIGVCTDDPAIRTLRGVSLPGVGFEHRWD